MVLLIKTTSTLVAVCLSKKSIYLPSFLPIYLPAACLPTFLRKCAETLLTSQRHKQILSVYICDLVNVMEPSQVVEPLVQDPRGSKGSYY